MNQNTTPDQKKDKKLRRINDTHLQLTKVISKNQSTQADRNLSSPCEAVKTLTSSK